MNRLRELREDHDLRPKDVAEVLGVSQQQYSRIEAGMSDISTAALSVLAEYYNVSSDYILGLIKRPRPLHDYKDSKYSSEENDEE